MSGFTLKLIALISMIIDHIGAIFFQDTLIFRYVGRIAFPIYAFFISEGCKYTKNFEKYLFRLGFFALFCEPLYDLTFYNGINFLQNTNTIFTLFFGSLIIYIIRNFRFIVKYLLITLIFLLVELIKSDYGIWGVVLILIFYFFQGKLKFILSSLLILFKNFNLILYYIINGNLYNHLIIFNISTLVSLFFIYMYNGKRGINIKYFFYIVYYLHFLMILLIR